MTLAHSPRRKPGECVLSRERITIPLSAVDTSTGAPGYKCPQCGKVIRFRHFNPYEKNGQHVADVVITYHKSIRPEQFDIDPAKPMEPRALAAVTSVVALHYTINGRVTLACNEVMCLINEVNQWRAWYAALPKNGAHQ